MPTPTTPLVIYDTEYTAWEGSIARNWKGPGEHREIVEIGAIRLARSNLAEEASFSVLVKPEKNPLLSDYFVRLTGITNAMIAAEGLPFAEALARFDGFAGPAALYAYGRDDKVMGETAALQGRAFDGPRWSTHDLRDWFQKSGLDVTRLHSSDLAPAAGAPRADHPHRALDDARAIAAAIRALMAKGHPSPFG